MAERDIARDFLSSASETAIRMTSHPDILNVTAPVGDHIPLLMPQWAYVVSAFVLFLIGFFGCFLNLMVILLMCKDRQLWTPLNIILFNLVCSDFSVSILGNPFTLMSALAHQWMFGHTMCVLYGFFMALLGITSITTLTVISFERYLMVTRPLSRRHLSSRGAIGSVLFIWTYSLALTTPPLYGWGNYVSEAANISCSVNWHEQSMNALTYILFLFAMGQIVPFAVITFSYVNIIRTMRRNSQRLGRVNRAEARATTMVFIMIVAFTIAWTPYSVFALMEQFATEGIISPGAGVIPALVAKSSICYDPLIYVGMNTQFQKSIKRMFGIHSKRNSPDKQYANNTVTSPAHRLTSFNEISIKFDNTSSTINKKRNKFTIMDEHSEVTDNENIKPYPRKTNLCTIQENRTGSDVERSGDTLCDEDSSIDNRNLQNSEVVGDDQVNYESLHPTILAVDSELLVYTQNRNNDTNVDNIMSNIYGNEGFEEHPTDYTDSAIAAETLTLKHSYSFEHQHQATAISEKRRKLSIDAKLEPLMQTKNLFKDRKVVTKFLDQASKQTNSNYQSYLFSIKDEGQMDSL